MAVAVILEGGLVRGVYVDGRPIDAEVFDFDILDGGEAADIRELRLGVEALDESELKRDALTYFS